MSHTVAYMITNIKRQNLQGHMVDCPRRKAECPHCGASGGYKWIVTKHLEECPKLEVSCPNKGCGQTMVHLLLPKHRQECPHEPVACKYETFGCTVKVPRQHKDKLDYHEQNFSQHYDLVIRSLQNHQQHYAYFKIEEFSYYKSVSKVFKYNADTWNWYIEIDTNGRGEGKGTHLSVRLQWKHVFRNMPSWLSHVKIELLNFREDKNHIAYTFTEPDGLSNERFVAHSDLGYNPLTNCQYLKDENICFRVTSTIISCKIAKANSSCIV